MKTKTFDCVTMKHQAAEKIQEMLAGMTREKVLAYWRQGTEELRQRQQTLREQGGKVETPEAEGEITSGSLVCRSLRGL